MVRPEGFELPTYRFVACCSIQLSYERLVKMDISRASEKRQAFFLPFPKKKACLLRQAFRLSWCGAPGEIRTPDPQVRSLLLYPAEPRAPDNRQHRQKAGGRQAFFSHVRIFFVRGARSGPTCGASFFPKALRRNPALRLDHGKNVS